jgi:TRAF3-interacting protein 1
MGDTAVDPDILKHTQDTLGQIINAPALTEKLLSRPPVQFLQDIVKSVWQSFLFCFFNDIFI